MTTASLNDATQVLLQDALGGQFRYFRTYRHFRRSFPGGASYVLINALTHGRGTYYLAFYPGVRHDELESRIKRIRGEDPKLSHDDRSIFFYSANVGPASGGWRAPMSGTWSLEELIDLDDIAGQVTTFCLDVVVPYLTQHESVENVRSTLLNAPERALNHRPYEQILVVDRLAGDEAQADADLALLEERYAPRDERWRDEFYCFREKFLAEREGGV